MVLNANAPRRTPPRMTASRTEDATRGGAESVPAEASDEMTAEAVEARPGGERSNSPKTGGQGTRGPAEAKPAEPVPAEPTMEAEDSAGQGDDQDEGAGAEGSFVELSEEQYRSWFSSVKKFVTQKATSVLKAGAQVALPAAGGALGGWLGGPVGGALGAKAGSFVGGQIREVDTESGYLRAVQLAQQIETDQAQLEEIVAHVLNESVPVLVDALATEIQERQGRGISGPADDEVMERFWGNVIGKVVSVAANELPWAIKKATQYLDTFDRDADSGTINPIMVDPETSRRFWGPAIAAVVTSVQSALPEIFAALDAGSKRGDPSPDGAIPLDDFLSSQRLPGGDCIALLEPTAIEDSNSFELVLEIPPHKSWWKGLEVRAGDDSLVSSIEVGGDNRTATIRLSSQQLAAAGNVVLSKADGAYKISGSELVQFAGQRLHFYWFAG